AWSLFDGLAQDWAGLSGSKDAGWDDDPLYQALRQQFNAFIDAPTDIAEDGVARGLADLTERLLSDTDEDVREADVRSWLTDLTGSELVQGTKVAPSDLDRNVWRLEFAIAVAVMAHRLNLMLAMWPEVAAELELFDTLPTEVRRPPVDLAVAVPESPMGNVLGFQYVEDEASRRDGQLGEFRFFRYTGVGRALLVNMPNLFPADGPGPNVVLLSGTSWAGTSPRYHIDVPVGAILCP
ncbi:transposase, partial [Actinoplanes sp. ATCC 53533]